MNERFFLLCVILRAPNHRIELDTITGLLIPFRNHFNFANESVLEEANPSRSGYRTKDEFEDAEQPIQEVYAGVCQLREEGESRTLLSLRIIDRKWRKATQIMRCCTLTYVARFPFES